ncbi:Hypothetical predicted protein [Pelobates cultripes]|uniref:Uncharacterized protein n=1 Tax=Pelobates cultripes TaxID=61616 RepID=A0AAD1TC56_PELCU|nr:Hypothetical predicted protein [Pelobates cultripes]
MFPRRKLPLAATEQQDPLTSDTCEALTNSTSQSLAQHNATSRHQRCKLRDQTTAYPSAHHQSCIQIWRHPAQSFQERHF